MEQGINQSKPGEVAAILDEMQFWNRQLDEHARLIRSGVEKHPERLAEDANR